MPNSLDVSQLVGSTNPIKIFDIHWKTQDSTEESLLFYRIPNGEEQERIFFERIKLAKYQWLVINRQIKNLPERASVLAEGDWPEVQKKILDQLYPIPKLKLIALTGTNGKTTTTDLVLQIAHQFGVKGISIGTLGVRECGQTLLDFGLTSPSLIDLRKFLFNFGKNKDFCVMEASSHALHQARLYGLEFDGGGWLSFSQDHLDYHKNMEDYFKAKCLIFQQMKDEAHFFIPDEQHELWQKLKSLNFSVEKTQSIKQDLPVFFKPQFNRNNLEVAWSIVKCVFNLEQLPNWHLLTPPEGRFFIRSYQNAFVIVDFAHTPDALDNICRGIKQSFKDYKLKVLFGCGGDRDRSKRPLMAKAASHWAEKLYITSDNPRNEDPEQIIQDILAGVGNSNFVKIIDRRVAVKTALEELKSQEVLLLAGKGHEDYILIKGVKHPYSDIAEVEKWVQNHD